jgi:hypothetical protein
VSGDRDPFERLPDELLAAVFLMLSLKTLLSGACELVCRRWARVMKSAPVTRRKPEDLWGAYALGSLNRPHTFVWKGEPDPVGLIAVGRNGYPIYTTSGTPGSGRVTAFVSEWFNIPCISTCPAGAVNALAVGLDGNTYFGSNNAMLFVLWGRRGG